LVKSIHRGLLRFFLSLNYSKKPQGRNLKCQIFIQHFFKIVLYWCLDLIRHNIGTHLKLNKYIFDISYPFCHHFYLSATLKQCFTEFAVCRTTFHHVDMSVRGRIPTCDLIGRLFLGSGLKINTFFAILTLKINDQSNRS
jgi:hypothetical protein